MFKKHKAEDIICELLPNEIFSYQGFYDIANPDGDYNIFPFLEVISKVKHSKEPLFRHFKSITKPTLVVYGEKDKWAWDIPKMIEILKKLKPEFTYKVIKDADHALSKHQGKLASLIANWLSK
ncbi:MAG: alpha/beta hydrolase [bacterium]|nr:alpha/beta hydrolase [bacterium]